MSTSRAMLTNKEIAWAYKKWCEGVPVEVLSQSLYCCSATLRRAFKRHGLVYELKPPVYKEE